MDSIDIQGSFSEGIRQRLLPRTPKATSSECFGRAQHRFIVEGMLGAWIS